MDASAAAAAALSVQTSKNEGGSNYSLAFSGLRILYLSHLLKKIFDLIVAKIEVNDPVQRVFNEEHLSL